MNVLEVLEEKYNFKKTNNLKFVELYKHYGSVNSVLSAYECGTFLNFVTNMGEDKYKLHQANFCKKRFCPMCSWRKSLKDSLIITILMKYLELEKKYNFVFLTLTVKNVYGDELNDKIKEMNKAFDRFIRRALVKKASKGFLRKLEVTYQKEKYITKELYKLKKDYYKLRGLKVGDLEPNFDTYHPHFHCIIAVPKNYKKDCYISKANWLKLWREAMRDETITQVHVDDVRKNDNKEVFEIAKYSAKDVDYLYSDEVFDVFYNSLKGKQLLTYSGCFKEALKLFKKGDLDYLKDVDQTEYVYMIGYKWINSAYVMGELRELTQEEYNSINKNLVEELED